MEKGTWMQLIVECGSRFTRPRGIAPFWIGILTQFAASLPAAQIEVDVSNRYSDRVILALFAGDEIKFQSQGGPAQSYLVSSLDGLWTDTTLSTNNPGFTVKFDKPGTYLYTAVQPQNVSNLLVRFNGKVVVSPRPASLPAIRIASPLAGEVTGNGIPVVPMFYVPTSNITQVAYFVDNAPTPLLVATNAPFAVATAYGTNFGPHSIKAVVTFGDGKTEASESVPFIQSTDLVFSNVELATNGIFSALYSIGYTRYEVQAGTSWADGKVVRNGTRGVVISTNITAKPMEFFFFYNAH